MAIWTQSSARAACIPPGRRSVEPAALVGLRACLPRGSPTIRAKCVGPPQGKIFIKLENRHLFVKFEPSRSQNGFGGET